MVRPFAPNNISPPGREDFKVMREDTLRCSGQWVRHIPCEGDPQWVVMHFQHIPSLASINPEYALYNAEALLWGLADHFELTPMTYQSGHSGKPKRGSMFEVEGYLYEVKAAPVNHNGYIRAFLCRHDKCLDPRPEFCDEVAALTPC